MNLEDAARSKVRISSGMELVPQLDKIVVRPFKVAEQSAGGIFLPQTAQKNLDIGEVLAVGEGTRYQDRVIPMKISVGMHVLYAGNVGIEIEREIPSDGISESRYETLVLIRECDVSIVLRAKG